MAGTVVVPQHMSALGRANSVRLARARMKRWIREPASMDGSIERICEVVMDPPAHAESMAVFELLLCGHRIGRTWAVKFLGKCRMSEAKTVGGLSMRQRLEVQARLRGLYVSDVLGGAA